MPDRLQVVATRVAEEIPEAELKSLADSITHTGVHPKELDGRLLGLTKEVLGSHLSRAEKCQLREEFGKALAARLD